MRMRPIVFCLGLGAAPGFALVAHAQAYNVTVLQNAGGGAVSQPYAINAFGETVGYSENSGGGVDAVLWSATGSGTVLQDVGNYGFSEANAVNASGESVGTSESITEVGQHGVLWSATGTGTVLQDIGHAHIDIPVAINASGQSVGSSETLNGYEAVLWQPTGKGWCFRTCPAFTRATP